MGGIEQSLNQLLNWEPITRARFQAFEKKTELLKDADIIVC